MRVLRNLFVFSVLLGISTACGGAAASNQSVSDAVVPTSTTVVTDDSLIAVAVPGSAVYQLGERVYAERCAACHGVDGEGQFPDDPFKPDESGRYGAPPHTGNGHTWHHDDDLLIRYVKEGGMGDPRTFFPMPPAPDLTDAEIRAVFGYIKSWWTPEQQQAQRDLTLSVRDND